MPTTEATLLQTGFFYHSDLDYATAQSDVASQLLNVSSDTDDVGQFTQVLTGLDYIYREAIWFDLIDIPAAASITACTLKVYGSGTDPDDDFIIYLVSGSQVGLPLVPVDYSKLGSADLGQLNTTGWDNAGWNTLTLNAAGLVDINAALQSGMYAIGLRSEEDVNATPPPTPGNLQRVRFDGFAGTNPPVLTITHSTWPDIYPEVPQFPVTGKIDLPTYSVISSHMTGLDIDLDNVTDASGNIDLAVANWILWTGTGEKIAYDNATGHVTITSLETATPLTLAGDLTSVDLTTGNVAAVDGTISNELVISTTQGIDAIYSKLADDEVVFSGVSAPSPGDDEGDIYMDSTSGDFIIKTRDDGQAGTKTAILGDFSAM